MLDPENIILAIKSSRLQAEEEQLRQKLVRGLPTLRSALTNAEKFTIHGATRGRPYVDEIAALAKAMERCSPLFPEVDGVVLGSTTVYRSRLELSGTQLESSARVVSVEELRARLSKLKK